MQSKISQILKRLPADADPPTVRKVDADARPIIWLSLNGDRTIQQLNLYATNVLKKNLKLLMG